MANSVVQTIREAEIDARSLSEFISKDASFMVTRRLAPTVHTLDYYLNFLDKEVSKFGGKADSAITAIKDKVSYVDAGFKNAQNLLDNVSNKYNEAISIVTSIEPTVISMTNDAINSTAIEGGVLADTFVTVTENGLGTVARTQRDKNSERVSVLDFFTQSERVAYESNKAEFDAYRPLQAFLDYIRDNNVGTAYFEGEFSTSKGLTYISSGGNPKTRTITGTLILNEIGTEDKYSLLHVAAGTKFSWFGSITLNGVGDIRWFSRKCENALVIGGTLNSRDTFIDRINIGGGFKAHGVLIDNQSTGTNIGDIRATRCGSGLPTPHHSDTTTGVHISSNKSTGFTQGSRIQVEKLPDVTLYKDFMVSIGDELYNASIVTDSENTINIFPYLNPIHVDEIPLIYYMYGAGVAVRGNDTSVTKIGKITGAACGVVYHSAALYPANTGSVTAEGNGIALVLGGYTMSSAHLGGSIDTVYFENNTYDIVRRSRADMSFSINGEYALNLDKVVDLTARRLSDGFTSDSPGFRGIPLVHKGYPLVWEGYGGASSNMQKPVDVTDMIRTPDIRRARGANLSLAIPNDNLNRLYGYNHKEVILTGFLAGKAPDSTITFTPPEGYTINSLPSPVSFSGFKGSAARFIVRYDYTYNTFIVECLNLAPQPATFAVDTSQTIEPNTSYTVTVPFSGASTSKFYVAHYSAGNNGCLINIDSVSSNTVKVSFYNPTDTAITLPEGTVRVLEVD